MIHLIQNEIINFFHESISPQQVFLSNLRNDEYFEAPYAVVIPQKASLNSVSDTYLYQNNKTLQQTLSVTQPFNVEFIFSSCQELCIAVEFFLSHIPRYFSINQQAIGVSPKSIDYVFSQGGLDQFKSSIDLSVEYLIFSPEKDIPSISKITPIVSVEHKHY